MNWISHCLGIDRVIEVEIHSAHRSWRISQADAQKLAKTP